MNLKIQKWVNPNGEELHFQYWLPEQKTKASIVLIHGLGEHCNRYEHVAQFFNDHDIAVFALDHLGHGKSSGKRGHIPSFKTVNEYISALIKLAKETVKDVPIILYGHSMGGNMVLYYTLSNQENLQIKGVISTSPGLGVGEPIPPLKLTLAKVMNVLLPSMTLDNGLDVENLSHDSEVIQAYKDDPLVHPMISTRLAMELINKGDWILNHADQFPLPLFLALGEKDHIVDAQKVIEFAEKAPKDKTTFHLFEGLYHELHNEPQQEAVLNDMLTWIENLI
ncbi:MAG: hypothetical protein CL609_12490 [Anaerolineaceae bacterium]|nr:hypothetical protein [Anaerolineaceae bacterium]